MSNFDLRKYLVENKLSEETQLDTDKLIDASEKIAKDLAKDPKQLQQYISQAKSAGIDVDQITQAAKQLKAGSSPESVFKSISNSLKEATIDQAKAEQKTEHAKEIFSKMAIGSGVGGAVGSMIGLGALAAGSVLVLPAVIALTLAGAAVGYATSKGATRDTRSDSGGKIEDYILLDKAAEEFGRYSNEKLLDKNDPDYFYTRLSAPNKSLFYVVDNGVTPPELEGKKVYRISIEDRDVVGDEEALFNSRIKRGQEKKEMASANANILGTRVDSDF